jgi:hypothetical protein
VRPHRNRLVPAPTRADPERVRRSVIARARISGGVTGDVRPPDPPRLRAPGRGGPGPPGGGGTRWPPTGPPGSARSAPGPRRSCAGGSS